jgi:hypothetical protein
MVKQIGNEAGDPMPDPELREKTLVDCAESLEKLTFIFQDIAGAIADSFPGLSVIVGDYIEILKKEATFLREY